MKMIIGKKIGMTNIFSLEGKYIPVTVVKSDPNFITQIRTEQKDGYIALQIGSEESKKVKKPQEYQFKKAKLPKLRNLREVRISSEEVAKYQVGQKITVNTFKEGEKIDAIGISKGKGFAGVIKRHNFARGPMSHGSDHHREPGSIGAMYPQRVFKGKKLPGRMGYERVTVKNLKIVKIDSDDQTILVQGALPGPNKSLVLLMGKGEFIIEEQKKYEEKKTEKEIVENKEEDKKENGQTEKEPGIIEKEEQVKDTAGEAK
ncbi:50S ribosomal protein L3 [bacterium CG2_30_33_46]|nr:MAG: 50S ribosomal protein L3 [bacterium CG2_30_33_46]